MKPIRTSLILLLAAGLFPQAAAAQDLPKDLRSQVGELLNENCPERSFYRENPYRFYQYGKKRTDIFR